MIDTAVITKPDQHPVRTDVLNRLQQLRISYLATLSPHTRRAYNRDLRDFADFLGEEDPTRALRRLIERGQGEANSLTLQYKAHLIEQEKTPATINRRLSSLRSAVKLARMGGFIPWALDIPGVKSRPYRNTRGPGRRGFQKIMRRLHESDRPRDIRDRAIIRMLYDLALRRGELAGLTLADVDLVTGQVSVLGKGELEREPVALPEETARALSGWIEIRGDEPGPLFFNYDRRCGDRRLTYDGIYKIVLAVAARAGIKTRPHGFRHTAITEALELTNGNLAAVRDFSRHKSYEVLRFYDDNRQDRGGEVAKLVAKAASV